MAQPRQKVSVQSLVSPEHTGWMTKQGGSWKSWKRRWFVLKDAKLYYFKSQNDTDYTGLINITQDSFVRKESNNTKKSTSSGSRKFLFAIGTTNRVYFMYPESEAAQNEWIHHIQATIDRINNRRTGTDKPYGGSNLSQQQQQDEGRKTRNENKRTNPRILIQKGKDEIAFLESSSSNSKVREFWELWNESLPKREQLDPQHHYGSISFEVSVSGDMEKLSWRCAGPQNLFIQKMVDFFWNVGAPEEEIDHLNSIGAIMNPYKIGSWIDMSAKGGMDGGWFFPVDLSLKQALEAADKGPPLSLVEQWMVAHDITHVHHVGRDMGTAPPQQTELRFDLPGGGHQERFLMALNAFQEFGFPPIPDEAVEILKQINSPWLALSVVTSSEGFVKLGIICPSPSGSIVSSLCHLSGGNIEQLLKFSRVLETEGPSIVEFQHLMLNFGYGVYKEGFDVMFHYKVGEETKM